MRTSNRSERRPGSGRCYRPLSSEVQDESVPRQRETQTIIVSLAAFSSRRGRVAMVDVARGRPARRCRRCPRGTSRGRGSRRPDASKMDSSGHGDGHAGPARTSSNEPLRPPATRRLGRERSRCSARGPARRAESSTAASSTPGRSSRRGCSGAGPEDGREVEAPASSRRATVTRSPYAASSARNAIDGRVRRSRAPVGAPASASSIIGSIGVTPMPPARRGSAGRRQWEVVARAATRTVVPRALSWMNVDPPREPGAWRTPTGIAPTVGGGRRGSTGGPGRPPRRSTWAPGEQAAAPRPPGGRA